ncbi:MAG TPA: sialidase family protein [Anaerolineae bacterium]|nr:sialidase family protein [Anaerolineae bacterium]
MRYYFYLLIFLSTLFITTSVSAQEGIQQDPNWQTIEKMPLLDNSYGHSPPLLLADQNRTIHAFYSEPVDRTLIIFYNQWHPDTGWGAANDIILPPQTSFARVQDVFLDSASNVHLIFYAGNEQQATIYYTTAPLALAYQASAWSTPTPAGLDAGPIAAAKLIHTNNQFQIAYSGKWNGEGVYTVSSDDNGQSWSSPQELLLLNTDENLLPAQYNTTIDEQGNAHLIFGVFNAAGYGDSVYYTRFNQVSWEPPILLRNWPTDRLGVNQPSNISPAIQAYRDILIATYIDLNQQGGIVTHSFQYSSDNGLTWQLPEQPFGTYIGTSGPTRFVIDSAGILHMFFSHRTESQQIHGIWHTTWQNNSWDTVQPVISGPFSADPPFDPSDPTPILSQGNTIFMTWITDPGVARVGIFSSYTKLNTPDLPITPLPTPLPTISPDDNNDVLPTVTPVVIQSTPTWADVPPVQNNASAPLFAAFLTATLMVTTVLIYYRLKVNK